MTLPTLSLFFSHFRSALPLGSMSGALCVTSLPNLYPPKATRRIREPSRGSIRGRVSVACSGGGASKAPTTAAYEGDGGIGFPGAGLVHGFLAQDGEDVLLEMLDAGLDLDVFGGVLSLPPAV